MLTQPVQSRAYAIDRAITALAQADGTFAMLLNSTAPVWSGVAAKDADLDYLVLGESSELDGQSATFDGYSIANSLTVHAWTRDTSKATALAILGHLRALLHRRPLVLTLDDNVTPFATVRGSFSIITVFPDPTGDVGHGVARYDVESLQPAGQ